MNASDSKISTRIPVILLIAGAIWRIAGTGSAALWYDEAITLYRATRVPFFELFTNHTDASGDLLLELLERPLMLINHSVWLLRLPSLLAGLAALWLAWKIMQEMQFTPRQQAFGALFAAFLPGLLWIGQDARSYGLLAALAWIPALIQINQVSNSLFGIFQPWAFTLTPSWLTKSLIQAIWTTRSSVFNMVAFLLLLASLGLLYNSKAWKCRNALLLAWLVPICVLVFMSLFFFNIVLYRTLMPMLFPFCLFLAWEFGQDHASPYRLVLAALWTGMLLMGLVLWHPADRGGYLDRAAAFIRSQWQPGDVLVYETQTAARPFLYYLDLPHYSWPYLADPLMAERGIPNTDTADPTSARRLWLVEPEDGLITAAEQTRFDTAYPHGTPLWRIVYLQAAPIDIFLMEGK